MSNVGRFGGILAFFHKISAKRGVYCYAGLLVLVGVFLRDLVDAVNGVLFSLRQLAAASSFSKLYSSLSRVDKRDVDLIDAEFVEVQSIYLVVFFSHCSSVQRGNIRRLPTILNPMFPDLISLSNNARPMFRYSIASFLFNKFFNIFLTFEQDKIFLRIKFKNNKPFVEALFLIKQIRGISPDPVLEVLFYKFFDLIPSS